MDTHMNTHREQSQRRPWGELDRWEPERERGRECERERGVELTYSRARASSACEREQRVLQPLAHVVDHAIDHQHQRAKR